MNFIGGYGDDDDDHGADGEVIYCEICKEKPKLYKCPRCGVLTCSLHCCKQHKQELKCSGKRDRTQFITMREFKERDLANDFHFLEDVLQSKSSSKRVFAVTGGTISNGIQDRNARVANSSSNASKIVWPELVLPTGIIRGVPIPTKDKNLKRLVEKVLERGTRLVTMPSQMSRRTSNTTRLVNRPGSAGGNFVAWKVSLVFIMNNDYDPSKLLAVDLLTAAQTHSLQSNSFVAVNLNATNENSTLDDIVGEPLQNLPEYSLIRHTLRNIRPLIISRDIRILIQAIPSPSNNPTFFEISPETTLKDALYSQTVIENPVIYIGSRQNTSKLRIMMASLEVAEHTAEKRGLHEQDEDSEHVQKHVKYSAENEVNDDLHTEVAESMVEPESSMHVDVDVDVDDETEFFTSLKELANESYENLIKVIQEAEEEE